MRGNIDEPPSLVQLIIHGMTLNELQIRFLNLEPTRSIPTLQWCFLFLQRNEFRLRVGNSDAMKDVNLGNIMVQFRGDTHLIESASVIKFIDFWKMIFECQNIIPTPYDTIIFSHVALCSIFGFG